MRPAEPLLPHRSAVIPMLQRAAYFLRPTFAALIALGLIAGIANFASRGGDAESDFIGPGGPVANDWEQLNLTRVVLPSDKLAPDEVVRLQLIGLCDQQADGVGILQCYCFAAPANRAVTGPLERFGAMVRQGPFHCMARPRALLVGRPQFDDQLARVLVTVIDEDSRVRAFTFVLARQQIAQFKNCWMTEAVLPALPMGNPEELPAAPAT
jgi:hypothetical protein